MRSPLPAEARRWSRLAAAACLGAAAGLLASHPGTAAAAGEAPDEIVSPAAIGEVRFPHALHADELGFECSECHHETDAARLATPHPEYFEDLWPGCGSCHGAGAAAGEPRSCSVCHHDSPVTTADETLSAKVVIHRSCWACHDSGTGAQASASCGFCHAGAPAPEEEAR